MRSSHLTTAKHLTTCLSRSSLPASEHAASHTGLLEVLYSSLLDTIIAHLLGNEPKPRPCPTSVELLIGTVNAVAALRLCCRALRDAFDAVTPQVVLGCSRQPCEPPPSFCLGPQRLRPHTQQCSASQLSQCPGTLVVPLCTPASPPKSLSSSHSCRGCKTSPCSSGKTSSTECPHAEGSEWVSALLRRTPHVVTLVVRPWAPLPWSAALAAPCAPMLTTLRLWERIDLTDTAPIAAYCPHLIHLSLPGCRSLTSIQGLQPLHRSLTHLDLSGCASLTSIQGLQPLHRSLATLILRSCSGLPAAELQHLRSLTSLTHLVVSGCVGLETLECVAGLPRLLHLEASLCQRLHSLRGAYTLPSLTSLNLSACHYISDLSPLLPYPTSSSPPPPLQRLDLWGCASVSDLSPLAHLSQSGLTCLVLTGCCRVSDLSPLAALPCLTQLSIGELHAVEELAPLSGLTALAVLEMGGCWGVTSLQPLAGCGALTHLNIQRCRRRMSGQALAGLGQLRIVR